MSINIVFFIIILLPSVVHLCHHQLNTTSGTIVLLPYNNSIECTWIFNLSSISNNIQYRNLLLIFLHFDTEFGHDELFIGETIADISNYNSKLYRFSGSKLPDPCSIPLRGDIFTRSIWMQFTSDQTNTGSGFTIDYTFLVNQSISTKLKSPQLLINDEILHPSEKKSKTSNQNYSYPYGTISSPNYPQNYSNDIICRWHFYHRNAFIRLYIDDFHTELHYDTLTLYLGQNLNNRAMILHEWSGDKIDNRYFFIPNDNLFLVFNTDKTNNASGFSLRYEIIEKDRHTFDIYENKGIIHSNDYPKFLRTNIEYTWNIYMTSSNEIEINLIDLHFDSDHDSLQIISGERVYLLNTPKSFRIQTANETKLVLRTKHSTNDDQYRGFNLTYQKFNKTIKINNQSNNLPCGKKYIARNGTIDFNYEGSTPFDCLILIEVDDGHNIFLRFDDVNWDYRETFMEIGLFHHPNEYQMFHISDTLPGNWFIANYSQIWIRFYSSEFALSICTFRLFYSETIRWSTISPEPYVQVLDSNKLFPYRLISLPTNSIYHNLTQAYIWYINALDDECIHIRFQNLQAINDRRICFHVRHPLKIVEICTNEQFPFVYYHVGSSILSIEPEFSWMLVKYSIQIDKFKKITTMNEINFRGNRMVLTPPLTFDVYVHIEWTIFTNDSAMIIIDIENLDGTIPAELSIHQNKNTVKRYSLGTTSLTRFSYILVSSKSSFRIIYTSLSLPKHNQTRLFRLNLYKITKFYFNFRDFHYIYYKRNQTKFQWSIHGQYENSTFLATVFSSNKNIFLQTTANANRLITNASTIIPSSDFAIRYITQRKSQTSDFLIILYEQEKQVYQTIILNKISDFIETNHFATYDIHIQSIVFDFIDFIIIKADRGTFIRLYDLNVNDTGYFLLNSSSIITKKSASPIGLRFSIKSRNIKIDLYSSTKTPVQLRYKTRSIRNTNPSYCLITNIDLCRNNHRQTCNDSCSKIFKYRSSSMDNIRINHFWPYALRGSVTLIIENTSIENFEHTIYRNLRSSIAKIVRKFCSNYEQTCFSKDTDAIRADHVIVQSYEEQVNDHRLYVAIFIKDPYRDTIALTHNQIVLALERYQKELYHDIQHHIYLPSNIIEQRSLDPVWIYGVCLLALFVLIVVLLILITVLMIKTFQSTKKITANKRIKSEPKLEPEKDRLLISPPLQLVTEEDEQNSLTGYNEMEESQTSNSTATANLLRPPATSYYCSPAIRTSYFDSSIETAMKQSLNNEDNEPIPFIDDNTSIAHSRKSSACWSDRTSLSSRFGLAWRLNAMRSRSGSQKRSSLSNENDKRRRRRYHHRIARYSGPLSQQKHYKDEL